MAYATLTQLKSALRLTDSIDDTNLTLALNSAEEAINAWCGRTFGSAGTATTTRYYAAGKPDDVEVDDLTSITTVEWSRDGSTWTVTTDYQAEPLNRFTDGMTWPITRLRTINAFAWPVMNGVQTVRVTGVYQFGSIPSSVTQATILQASRVFARLSSPLGVAGFAEGIGGMYVRGGLDVDVQQLLMPYRRYRAAL